MHSFFMKGGTFMNVRVMDGCDVFSFDTSHVTPQAAAAELAAICEKTDASLDDVFKSSSFLGVSLWDTLKICSEAEHIVTGGSIICHRGNKRLYYNNQGGISSWKK